MLYPNRLGHDALSKPVRLNWIGHEITKYCRNVQYCSLVLFGIAHFLSIIYINVSEFIIAITDICDIAQFLFVSESL